MGDAGFRDLSQVDPAAPALLAEAIAADGSRAWYQRRAAKLKEYAEKKAREEAAAAAAEAKAT